MSDTQAEPSPRAEGTRLALIDAAIYLIGRHGFGETSTRAIAARAGTNVASIAYHFGGKEALRAACGQEIAARIARAVRDPGPGAATPEAAAAQLRTMLAAFVQFVTANREAADMVAFILRELSEESPAFEAFYAGVIAPRHDGLCRLWAQATGQPADSEDTRLAVFALIGQVLYFRIGQPIVLRRMDWAAMEPARVAQLTAVLTRHLDAAIAANRKPMP